MKHHTHGRLIGCVVLYSSLLHSSVCAIETQAWLCYYCRNIPRFPSLSLSVLQVSLLTVTLVYYIYYIYHSMIIVEVVELLQRHNHRGHVDISHLATWEQVRENTRWMKAEKERQERKYIMPGHVLLRFITKLSFRKRKSLDLKGHWFRLYIKKHSATHILIKETGKTQLWSSEEIRVWVWKMTTLVLRDEDDFFLSAAYSHSAWRYALPPPHEVCDCVGGEQDDGHLCYAPHPLALQASLANGKHIVQQDRQLGELFYPNSTCYSIIWEKKLVISISYICWDI